jgi:hypothetical protein
MLASDALHVWGKRLAIGHDRLSTQGSHESGVHLARVRCLGHYVCRHAWSLLHPRPGGLLLIKAESLALVIGKEGVLALGDDLLQLSRRHLALHHLPNMILLRFVDPAHELRSEIVDLDSILRGQPAQGVEVKDVWLPHLLHGHREWALIGPVREHARGGHPHTQLLLLLGHVGDLHRVLHGLESMLRQAPRGHLAHHHLMLSLLLGLLLQLSLPRSIVGELVLEIGGVVLSSFDHLRSSRRHGVIIRLLSAC